MIRNHLTRGGERGEGIAYKGGGREKYKADNTIFFGIRT